MIIVVNTRFGGEFGSLVKQQSECPGSVQVCAVKFFYGAIWRLYDDLFAINCYLFLHL